MYIWLFEAGQDRAEVAGAVDSATDEVADNVDVDDDDALDTADETLLPDDPPDTLIAEIVLLPAVV